MLLYRLAELMLEKENNVLPVDLLFDDNQIGDFVKSIQIDSPYQQLIFEGVLTESVKYEQLYVNFTVDGYFHYVLGELMYVKSIDKDVSYLLNIIEHNGLKGTIEGVEKSLLRYISNGQFEILAYLINTSENADKVSVYPLSNAFLIYPADFVLTTLFKQNTDDQLKLLMKVIDQLKSFQKHKVISDIYKLINDIIIPVDFIRVTLYLESIEYIDEKNRTKSLDLIEKSNLKEFETDSADTANFYYSLGNQFGLIGDYDKSVFYFEKALTCLINSQGDSRPELVNYYNSLGAAWSFKGKFEEGIKFYKLALELSILLGSNLIQSAARSYNNLGSALLDIGEYDDAIFYLEKGLEIRLKLFGSQHPDTAKSFNSLGMVWKEKGNIDKSLQYYEKSLNIRLKLFNDFHSSIGASYSNIGTIWFEKLEYEKSIFFHSKSIEVRKKVNGDQHSDVAISYNNLAAVFCKQGEKNKAIESFEMALGIWLKHYGEDHPHIASCYNNIGFVLLLKEDYEKAIEFYEKSLNIRLKVFGENHPHVGISYSNIADLWFKRGDFEIAIEYYQKALDIESIVLGKFNSQSGILYFNIAMSYMKLLQYEHAITYLENGGKCNPNAGGFPFYMGVCYEQSNMNILAIKSFILSAELRNKFLGASDKGTIESVLNVKRLANAEMNIELIPSWIQNFKSINYDA